jgi:hypothetical protein
VVELDVLAARRGELAVAQGTQEASRIMSIHLSGMCSTIVSSSSMDVGSSRCRLGWWPALRMCAGLASMRSSSTAVFMVARSSPYAFEIARGFSGVAVLRLLVTVTDRALCDDPLPPLPEGRHQVMLERGLVVGPGGCPGGSPLSVRPLAIHFLA